MSNIGTKFVIAQRFIFDPNSNSLVDQKNSNSDMVRLGSNEGRILQLLCERPNAVVTRNELHEFVWRDQGFEVDDSSLTQAISTLRKCLQDSTRSPQFIKTVPKRGYQLICEVSSYSHISDANNSADDTAAVADNNAESEAEFIPDIAQFIEKKTHHQTPATPPQTPPAAKTDKKSFFNSSFFMRIVILIAILMPVCVLMFSNPQDQSFRSVGTYNNVAVLTPVNHPQLTKWLPYIERCVDAYTQSHEGERRPSEVIATGGNNNRLFLNYIHDAVHSEENVTLMIIFDQNNLNQVCR